MLDVHVERTPIEMFHKGERMASHARAPIPRRHQGNRKYGGYSEAGKGTMARVRFFARIMRTGVSAAWRPVFL